jgi:hypothetical protein
MRAFVLIAALLLALCGRAALGDDRAGSGPDQGALEQSGPGNDELCLQQMLPSREYQALKAKFPPLEHAASPSLAQQADPTRATSEETKLILSFHQKYQLPCRQDTLLAISRGQPAAVLVLAESFVRSDANYLNLVERRITWGEYNKEVKAIRHDFAVRLMAAAQAIESDRQDPQRYQARQRQAAAALSDWTRQQQGLVRLQRLVNPTEQARASDCHYVGTTLTCTMS